ncbi:MAG: hypothetical protein AAGA48_04295 [Myxococcota bacterium]
MIETLNHAADRALASLAFEFDELERQAAANIDNRFVANRRHIHRLLSMLRAMLADLKGAGRSTVQDALKVLDAVQGAHVVWGAYRDRFEQREREEWRFILLLADDLARECTPAVVQREPPLVMFSAEGSPAVQPRGSPEIPPQLDTPELQQRFQDLVFRIPVPILHLPWRSWTDLPSLAVVAHEVGHMVERDLGLPVADVAADAVEPEDRDRARQWARELFADAWGVACCGDAFLEALALAEAASPQALADQAPRDKYPRALSRLRAAFAAFQALGLPDALAIESRWTSTFEMAGAPALADQRVAIQVMQAFVERTWTDDVRLDRQIPEGNVQDVVTRLNDPTSGLVGGTDARVVVRALAQLDRARFTPDGASALAKQWRSARHFEDGLLVPSVDDEQLGKTFARRLLSSETP